MIEIRTRLDDGEWARYEYGSEPRGLLEAAGMYHARTRELIGRHGDDAAGWTWVEVDGRYIHWYDVVTVATEDRARALLADVASGTYDPVQSDAAAEICAAESYDFDWLLGSVQ